MPLLEAIFVDFDGTLVHSEHANAKAYSKAIEIHGFKVSPEKILSTCLGRHWKDFLPNLLPSENHPRELAEKIALEKKKIYREFFSEITLNHPLINLLTSCHAIPKGLVTNASQETVLTILNKFEIVSLFDVIICQEDVKLSKPDPECYLKAIRTLNVEKQNCIAIEDSDVGINAAKKAGIPTLKIAGA